MKKSLLANLVVIAMLAATGASAGAHNDAATTTTAAAAASSLSPSQSLSPRVDDDKQRATFEFERQAGNDSAPVFGNHKPSAKSRDAIDGSVVYMVANSHIDTQWNWTVQDTIRQWVPRTFFDNFKLFEQFPNYKFNFEGAIHYMFFKEHHPEAWSKLQAFVAQGRWKLAGSWINAVDTNVPSPESLMRQGLYGKRFFKREFGYASEDIYLPDCFGFGYALPSIAAHTGFRSFSTQKLTWGGALPSPFAVGRWQGADGSTLIASLRGGNYVAKVRSNPTTNTYWGGELTDIGNTGKRVGFRYFGVGDQGGAPDETSVSWVEKGLNEPRGTMQIRNTAAEQLGKDLSPEDIAGLPQYRGELVMKTHGVGCYTSQAAMKKWNRRNEQLGDAAERAALCAQYTSGAPYPRERLREAWTRFLFHQFHDDVTGTSIPQAYTFSWNDELLSLNQFAQTTISSVGAVAANMDTRAQGVPLVIYNPLAFNRRDAIEATVHFKRVAPAFVRVFDLTTNAEVPSQIIAVEKDAIKILILADVPSTGFKVFDVQASDAPSPLKTNLSATNEMLENARYTVKFDANGDVASVFDKQAKSELLQAPAGIELLDNKSFDWAAWEIKWETLNKPSIERLSNPTIKIVERGNVRVCVEITRRIKGSTFVQRVSLTEGGDRVDFDTQVDWQTPAKLAKASFPLRAANAKATYDLGLGTIERGNNQENLYEVPGQQWADITDMSGAFGTSILNDSKYGWDKPADNVLRLTLLHTPGVDKRYVYQATNDIGHHRFTYSIAGHQGDWRTSETPMRAARLNQPLQVFQTVAHDGRLGKSFSMLRVGQSGKQATSHIASQVASQIAVRAFKKAEDSDEIVLRVQELYGRPARGGNIALAGDIASVREINAAEEATSSPNQANIENGKLVFDLKPYQPRTFALKLNSTLPNTTQNTNDLPSSTVVALPFNLDGISPDGARRDGDFDGKGRTLAAELLPEKLELDGINFKMGDAGTLAAKNVVIARGQRIRLPKGDYNRLYLIAAAVGGGDERGVFTLSTPDGKKQTVELKIQDWSGVTGQWDSRLVDDQIARETFAPPEVLNGEKWSDATVFSQMIMRLSAAGNEIEGLDKLRPAFIKPAEVAWIGTHRHAPAGNEPYIFTNLFKYRLDVPQGATILTLPNNGRIRIIAISAAKNQIDDTRLASVLYE